MASEAQTWNGPQLDGLRTLKFAVADCDRALAFYERVFGAQRIPRADHRDAEGHIYAYVCHVPGLGVLDLRLSARHAAAAARFDPVSVHVARKADLEAWATHLDALEVNHSGIIPTGLSWTIVIEDPDGRFIKLFPREGHGPEIVADKNNDWMRD